jgi:hypothetical protein
VEATEGEIEAEDQEGPGATTELAPTVDAIGDSSDPVRLYLTEIGNFQLLSRAQEVEIAKRIQAGENEVQEEVMRSAVTQDLIIEIGAQVETHEADVGHLFEESEEPADADEQGGREAKAKLLKQLSVDYQTQVAARPHPGARPETEGAARGEPEGETREGADAPRGEHNA